VFVAEGKHDGVLPPEGRRIIGALPQDINNTLKIYDAGHGCLDKIKPLLKDVLSWLNKL
jgi:hypothetical protein